MENQLLENFAPNFDSLIAIDKNLNDNWKKRVEDWLSELPTHWREHVQVPQTEKDQKEQERA